LSRAGRNAGPDLGYLCGHRFGLGMTSTGGGRTPRRVQDLTTPSAIFPRQANLHATPVTPPAPSTSARLVTALRGARYSLAWQTASTLLPSGSRTNAP